jgi:hypothetical protein
MTIIVHPVYARRIAETAASARMGVVRALDRLVAQLEALNARCPVAPAGALEHMRASIVAAALMDFVAITVDQNGTEAARLRSIVIEAHEHAAEMLRQFERRVRFLETAAGIGPNVATG